jgi:hypothetical protein
MRPSAGPRGKSSLSNGCEPHSGNEVADQLAAALRTVDLTVQSTQVMHDPSVEPPGSAVTA